MKYTKPPITFSDQVDLLIRRGMKIESCKAAAEVLSNVNYYRLSGYWYPYLLPNDNFRDDTDWEIVWRHYTFDRRLRVLVMDAIERVEIAVRTQVTYVFSHTHGNGFAWLDKKHYDFKNYKQEEKHSQLVDEVRKAIDRSKEVFVEHYFSKYDEVDMPLWMASELMTFGNILTLYSLMGQYLQREIAYRYGLHAKVFHSWLLSLNYIRNVCAHHGRLWNKTLPVKPLLPNKQLQWKTPVEIYPDKICAILTLLRYMLYFVAPKSNWAGRFRDLLAEYSDISTRSMGFPQNWMECPIWNGTIELPKYVE